MKTHTGISRRHLIQQMAAVTLGTVATPLMGVSRSIEKNTPGKPANALIYIAPGKGKKGRVGEMNIVFKLDSLQTSGHIGVWESEIQPGELGAPPHYHITFDEICHVKEGSLFVMTDEIVTEVKAGGWHLRPKGRVHTFWNSGSTPARTIDISLPGGHEYYMQDLAALFENNNRPKPADFTKLSEKYDIHYRFDMLEAIMKKYKVKL